MKQYSADLRERLLGAIDAGLPQIEAARLFGVSVSSIKRWRTQQRQTGSLVARRRTGRRRRVRPDQEAALLAQVAATPDALCGLGRDHRRAPQHRHHVAHPGAPGPAAEKKSLIATERDEDARAAWRADAAELDFNSRLAQQNARGAGLIPLRTDGLEAIFALTSPIPQELTRSILVALFAAERFNWWASQARGDAVEPMREAKRASDDALERSRAFLGERDVRWISADPVADDQ